MRKICLIDSNHQVKISWQKTLGGKAEVDFYSCFADFFAVNSDCNQPCGPFFCIIVCRIYEPAGRDILKSRLPAQIKSIHPSPLFLNWHSFVPKSALGPYFDGTISQCYGVCWDTLRLKVASLRRKKLQLPPSLPMKTRYSRPKLSRHQLSEARKLLLSMASKEASELKSLLTTFAMTSHLQQGVDFLETLYYQLITYRDAKECLASRLIHSSPLVAARILRRILFPPS